MPVESLSADAPAQSFDFDIPAMPLGDALKRFGAVTRHPALFRSEILAGQRSSAVQGRYSPEAALLRLLAGTGLVPEQFHTAAGVAWALKEEGGSSTAPVPASLGDLSGYPSLVQARVWRALCGNARTRPGSYRSLLRFQIDAAGQVRRPRLLGSTGDALRDKAMIEVLRDVRVDDLPPPAPAQTLTLLIVPTRRDGVRCDDTADSGVPAP